MTRLSSRRTRRKPLPMACASTSRSCTGSRERIPPAVWARIVSGVAACSIGLAAGAAKSSSKVSMSWCLQCRVVDSVHRAQALVQIVGSEIHTGVPGDRREPVIEIELGEAVAIAQRLEALAVEVVRQIHHAFAPIAEFQPNLVVPEIPCIDHVPLYVLV